VRRSATEQGTREHGAVGVDGEAEDEDGEVAGRQGGGGGETEGETGQAACGGGRDGDFSSGGTKHLKSHQYTVDNVRYFPCLILHN